MGYRPMATKYCGTVIVCCVRLSVFHVIVLHRVVGVHIGTSPCHSSPLSWEAWRQSWMTAVVAETVID